MKNTHPDYVANNTLYLLAADIILYNTEHDLSSFLEMLKISEATWKKLTQSEVYFSEDMAKNLMDLYWMVYKAQFII